MSSSFTRKFQSELRSKLKEKMKGYKVYSREGWLRIDGKRVVPVDIMIESQNKLILLEIESHREDPVNNIAKIPYWLKRNPIARKILVIQLFSPFYEKHKIKKGISEELGEIITEKFKGKVQYVSLPFHPKLSFKQFDEIYKKPIENPNKIGTLIRETSEQIIKILFGTYSFS